MSEIDRVVREIVDEMRQRSDWGEVATYIPELARVDAKAFGLVVIDADGHVTAAGDSEMPFFDPEHLEGVYAHLRPGQDRRQIVAAPRAPFLYWSNSSAY